VTCRNGGGEPSTPTPRRTKCFVACVAIAVETENAAGLYIMSLLPYVVANDLLSPLHQTPGSSAGGHWLKVN
jgi:hypothetical protein